jgi:Pentapeptide repeats (8 copies)
MAKPPSSTAKIRKPATVAEPAPDPAAEPPVAFDAEGLKRVQDIIKNARATWFALLGALVFASITLASVKDVSFFVNTVETKLPLVGISVPVTSFFWAGSLLIAAIYAYFHLYLELLWQALGDAPARERPNPKSTDPAVKEGVRLADRIEPWIVADTALAARDWLRGASDNDKKNPTCSRDRAMPRISGFVAFGLVWLFGLAVIFWFWWRYMPAHEAQQTLFLGLVLTVTYFVRAASLASAWSHLKFPNGVTRRTVYWQWTAPLVFLAMVGTTLVRTGRPPVMQYEPVENPLLFGETVCAWRAVKEDIPPPLLCWRRSDFYDLVLKPAKANLRAEIVTEKPKDWQGKKIAETEFRLRWCRENTEFRCDNPFDPMKRKFESQAERDFQAAWQERWAAQLNAFSKPDLRDKDLRRANLISAKLEGVQLAGARLEGAVLAFAEMEGASLSYAQLQGAELGAAGLEGADLSNAKLENAELTFSRLEGANLASAQLFGKKDVLLDLISSRLAGANLTAAALRNARISTENVLGSKSFILSFGDASVLLPENFPPPCQWGKTRLSDPEFFGRWEGWVGLIGFVPLELSKDKFPAIPPPPGCDPPNAVP